MKNFLCTLLCCICTQFMTFSGARAGNNQDTVTYTIDPQHTLQKFEGWGVSLCWWANMCGRWDDEKIDEIIDLLVSPEGLNYRFFRYNIGGGDDPENRHCRPHHMGKGKGLRAEMEGFKDSPDGDYLWERDSAQRKIMLKIKEKRPDAIFEAFSNSCPYYMTHSGCIGGHTDASSDNLRKECYGEFAQYLVDVCRHYKDAYGIEFRTLEPFNEPMTDYWYASGSQEGCHFDVASQIEFIKVLHPILKASGLSTVISASDETGVAQSVEDFKAYRDAGILDLIGQWNTHTYSADHRARTELRTLCREAGIPLWMTEVGEGGRRISGNLRLAQKLIDDMRHMQPAVWTDWQYMEEDNDQWCFLRGIFAEQSYRKVKNYSIRQHFSKYIKEGYTILHTTDEHTLAAMQTSADSLTAVLVTVNPTLDSSLHRADLSVFPALSDAAITALRTTQTEDLKSVEEYTLTDHILEYRLPPHSIMTFVISLRKTEQK